MDWVSAPNIEDAPAELAQGRNSGGFRASARDRVERFLEAERAQ
jgi:hypothetical protein